MPTALIAMTHDGRAWSGIGLAHRSSMATYQSPLTVIAKGALAGAAGTAVMGAFMERAPQ